MAQRIYGSNQHIQDGLFQAITPAVQQVLKMEYAGALANEIGAELWGSDDLTDGALYTKVYFRTGLVGTAARVADNFRQSFPSATYFSGEMLIKDYGQVGIAYDYYPEDWRDYKDAFNFITDLVGDLPRLLADAEETDNHRLYNLGTTLTGGVFDTPLFVDGVNHKLQLIGRPDYFAGAAASNILYGGISYALIQLINQYGDEFINEEGLSQPVNVVMIVASRQNADLLEALYGAGYNLESGNPNSENPVGKRPRPRILGTNRIANRNDLWVFYDGWQNQIKERSSFRGLAESWEEGNAQHKRVVSQIRSRYGYYFLNNRLVLLVKGAA